MKRIVDNLHIDLIAAGLMVGMMATGYVLRFPLPPGSNKSLVLWGLTRHQWGDIHFWISVGLLAVVFVHVGLHWQWVHISVKRLLSPAKSRGTRSLLSGLTALLGFILVFALFAWAAQNGVKPMEDRPDGVCPTSESDAAENPPDARRNALEQFAKTAQAQPTFRKDVYPILERSCVSCHGPKSQRAGFRIDREEDFSREFGGMPLIVPGKSAESSLITILSGLRKDIARPDVHRLSSEQLSILKAWIDAGASWDYVNAASVQ